MKYSSIQVTFKTKQRLNALKLTPSESYENIILRLLDVKLHGREIVYTINSVDGLYSLNCSVDWGCNDLKVLFFDDDDNLVTTDDVGGDEWGVFVGEVMGCVNLVNFLAVLDVGDSVRVGGLVLVRE